MVVRVAYRSLKGTGTTNDTRSDDEDESEPSTPNVKQPTSNYGSNGVTPQAKDVESGDVTVKTEAN